MAFEIELTPRASLQVTEIFEWYEKRQDGLGERFFTEVEKCFEQISEHPLIFKSVHKDFRRALLARFPYAVFFKPSADGIRVYCICHTARKSQT